MDEHGKRSGTVIRPTVIRMREKRKRSQFRLGATEARTALRSSGENSKATVQMDLNSARANQTT
jgi:hypothetical protein